MTRIIIFGKNGQVASNLLEIFAYDKNFEIFNYSSAEIDFNEIANLSVKLDELPTADFMINATAYNHVDQAEDEPIKADNINHQAISIIANFCKEKSIKLIHYSTNYVFDGKGDDAYFEDNIENLQPLSIYGKSKLAGENAIQESGCNYLIFRVATVFDLNKNNNFPAKIKELAQTRDELKIVNDQFTNPTNSYDIARSTKIIIEQIIASRKFKNGIYHMVSNKPASYYDIACEVLKSQKTKIIPVDSSLFPTKAERPKNGVLNCDKIKKDFGIEFQNFYKQVTIIIVTYKSSHIIELTLKNIINKGYKIVIIDNGSDDTIESILQQRFKNTGIELIKLANNIGFGKANNIALRKTTTKYAFILNPDSITTEDSIDKLVEIASLNNQIALANPLFVAEDDLNMVDKFKYYKKFGFVGNEQFKNKNDQCGGALLMRVEIFRIIGFFDENIFLYAEDNEISARSLQFGFKNIVAKDSFCFHYNQNSTKIDSKWKEYKMIYFRSWHQGWGSTYLKKRNKHIVKILLKVLHRFCLSFCYLITLNPKSAINRFALASGSLANLIGIDCFTKKNKKANIKSITIL